MEITADDDGCGQIPPRIVEVQGFPLELHRTIEQVHSFEAVSMEDFLRLSCTS